MTAAPALPRGWEHWPVDKKQELLAGLQSLAQERETGRGPWLCDREDCDGRPHKGRRNEHARSVQRAPAGDDWDFWLLLAGRGFGKTRTGAEWVIRQAKTLERGALIGPTAADVRDTMIEGESGILACARPSFRPVYHPSKRKVEFPNGSALYCYSAEEPERLRGPQHHYLWCIAEGEPILTARGWVPIEDVTDQDLLATRTGWGRCSGSFRTKRDAELMEIVTESGARVVCTPEHRIASTDTGWVEARFIECGDTIQVWNSQTAPAHPPRGSSGASDGTTGNRQGTTGTAGAGCCTGTCGSRPTERSRPGTSSTMPTTTRPTTSSATCGCSPTQSTTVTTARTTTPGGCTPTSTGRLSPSSPGSPVRHARSSVLTVGGLTSPQDSGPSTALSGARPERVVSVSRLLRRADVYDIGVPGHGEFVAGGVVVHNCDEWAAWRYLQQTWDMALMGLRLGEHPRGCITTTPRPLPLVREAVKDERFAVVRGSTYDNLHNLAPVFRRSVLDRYAGTTLGRQELDAEILEDLPGALVQRKHIHHVDAAPELDLVVVGVDPAGTGTGDEAGIVVVGRGAEDQHVYVLADLSRQMSARETGLTAWKALYDHGASLLVYEDNFGKQWLRDGLIDAYADHHELDAEQRLRLRTEEDAKRSEWEALQHNMQREEDEEPVAVVPTPYRMLRKVTAQHGKVLRAQPVAMRYEQGKIFHVGRLDGLELQLTSWDPHETPNESPDRVDALVHAVTHLLRREKGRGTVVSPHAAGLGRAIGGHPFDRLRRRSA